MKAVALESCAEICLELGKSSIQITAGDKRRLLTAGEQMQQSQQVAGFVVERSSCQQHHILIAADVFHVRIGFRLFVAVVVCLIHYHHIEIRVMRKKILNFLQIASGEYLPIMQAKLGYIFMPATMGSASLANKTRRADDKTTLAAHGSH